MTKQPGRSRGPGGNQMASRLLGTSAAQAVLTVVGLALGGVAVSQEGTAVKTPRYSYLAFNYEETETKEGVDPSDDIDFNNGDFSLFTVQGSLGITDWFHLHGEYFDGDCNSCESVSFETSPGPPPVTATDISDRDFNGYKIGGGINYALGFIGLEQADLILRAHYLEVELDNIDEDGYSIDTLLRAQVSDRAEIWVGTEYQDLDEIENIDFVIGLGYELWNGLTLTGSGIIFNNESGFDIGLRWYFGDQLLDRDSLF